MDDAQWGKVRELTGYRVIPFLEKEGHYWGPPADARNAIEELERLRSGGAAYLAVAWPSFWWLEHYSQFHDHLRESFACLLDNERLVVFALK